MNESRWRPEVVAFADLMEARLRANDHKPGWKEDSPHDLLEGLGAEPAELVKAINRHCKRLMWADAWVMETDTEQRVGREAADVANFAMMIADVCGALSSEVRSTKSEPQASASAPATDEPPTSTAGSEGGEWVGLIAAEFAKPQFMTTETESGSYKISFRFAGDEARERCEALEDAFRAAGRAINGPTS